MISVFTVAALDSSFFAIIYGVLLVLLIGALAGSPASHFRRRLWPTPQRRSAA